VTEITKGPFSQGSIFKTFPIDSSKIVSDPLELMIAGNLPSDGEMPDKYYTQTIDAMLTGGNAIKDGGEMSCLFLWSEFFKTLGILRKKSHTERLIPFALGVADGELGYNINSQFAAEGPKPRKQNTYRSNKIYGKKTKETLGDNFTKIPLYRYFFPLLTSNYDDAKKSPFRTNLNPENTFSGYNLSGNFFAIMDSGYGATSTGPQLEWLKKELSQQTYKKKFAIYNRSLYPYCDPSTPFDYVKRAEEWTPVFEANV